jgi:hypothetical protein
MNDATKNLPEEGFKRPWAKLPVIEVIALNES